MKINLKNPDLKNIDVQDIDLYVLYSFADDRPLRKLTGLCDWRLNSKISNFVYKAFFNGEFNEKLLFSPKDRLSVKGIILFGLGKKKEFTLLRFRDAIRNTFKTVFNIKAYRVALSIPPWESLKIRASQAIDVWLTELQPFVSSLKDKTKKCEFVLFQDTADQRFIIDPVLNFVRRYR